MTQPQVPAGFVMISPGVCIGHAPVRAVLPQPHDLTPNVILIFGWFAALTRHLEGYSRKYTEIYPNATQIIVECPPFFFLSPERRQESRLLPVVKVLEGLGCLPSAGNTTRESARPRPRVLLHSLSNGGALQLMYLGRLLTSRYPSIPPSEHLVSALVLDSSPALGGFHSFSLGTRVVFRDPVVRYIVMILICSAHAYHLALQTVGIEGLEMMGPQFLETLLDPRLFPWMNSKTPRLYIFSKGDSVISWRAVQRHAEAAKMSGLNVRCEVYEKSAHIAHMRSDPKRYWSLIQDLWQVACREDPEQYSTTRRSVSNGRLSKL